jgi:hypothetical protein
MQNNPNSFDNFIEYLFVTGQLDKNDNETESNDEEEDE